MSHLNIRTQKYRGMIGVGGIGSGSFFELSGNDTLGREESRGGRFLDRKDYCKLHIIAHYVQTLLGPDFETIPVGKVGNDDAGRRLIDEMRQAGMRTDLVRTSPGDSTLFSFCFAYPDGAGGNLTSSDSACSKVDAACVTQAVREFAWLEDRGIALAAPEVPMEARERLLDLGTRHSLFRAAAFTSEEMPRVVDSGLLKRVDLLAANLDEAAAAVNVPADGEPDRIVGGAVEALGRVNPKLRISITGGVRGSWTWDGAELSHVPAFDAEVASTAGAGDAHFAGILVGLAAGLALRDAQEFGALVAALSVTSPHTIDKRIDRESLREFAEESSAELSDPVRALLEE